MEASCREFRRARLKIVLRKIVRKILTLSFLAIFISLINFSVHWWQFGSIPPLTENDLADLIKLNMSYHLSGWWDILFSWLLVMLIYLIFSIKILKREIGRQMRNIFGFIVVALGIYFSFAYGAIFYGLVFSVTFISICLMVIVARFMIKAYILAGL